MSILKNFIKYQSLGNDFIVFDWYKKPALYVQNELHDAAWPLFVKTICDRHYGVGADGVLIITSCPQAGMPEMLIFNADGTQAESCLNGLRCVAQHLFGSYAFPESFSIKLGERVVECIMQKNRAGAELSAITMRVGHAESAGMANVEGSNGHIMRIGNPHFIIFGQATPEMLTQQGHKISTSSHFAHGTNVEFVWQIEPIGAEKQYNLLVYERGCGITLACSSGAAAVTGLLFEQGAIERDEVIVLHMLGGSVRAWVDKEGSVVLQAQARLVFSGTLENANQSQPSKPQPMVQS